MSTNDLAAVLKTLGVPGWAVVSLVCLLAVLFVLEKAKLLRGPPQKSREEIMASSEQTFRSDLLDRVQTLEGQRENDEKLRSELMQQCAAFQVELNECKTLHADVQRDLNAVRDELAACSEHRAEEHERYVQLQARVTALVEVLKARGIDLLFSITDAEVPAIPTAIDLLSILDEENDAHGRG